ncbi:MAG TPA: YetF domain-containing protein [Actinomycetota bacterium]|nr:YetF domain-containing protein [Actinomycetota bacterium]
MFDLGAPLWQIALRALAVYAAVFLGFRVLGKRELGQMTVFDLVLILLLSNAVQNAMVGPDTSLQGGLVAAAVLLVANRLVAETRLRSPLLDRLFEGRSAVLVEHGKLVTGQLRRQGVAEEDLAMAMREHGIASLDDVQLAVLETDGSISIVPASSPTLRSHRRRARALRRK